MTDEKTLLPAPDDRTIHQRMIAILTELPAIGKNQRNTQQNFNFRGHDDVLNALTPLLAKHGVVIVPRTLDRVTAQRETSGGKAMYEVNLHIEYTFYGAAGDSITGSAWGEGTDMGDKSTMKAGTMAFKAMLNQAFAINTEEGAEHDTDRGTVEETIHQAQRAQPGPFARKEDVDKFLAAVAAAGFDPAVQTEQVDKLVQDRGGVPVAWLSRQQADLDKAIKAKKPNETKAEAPQA